MLTIILAFIMLGGIWLLRHLSRPNALLIIPTFVAVMETRQDTPSILLPSLIYAIAWIEAFNRPWTSSSEVGSLVGLSIILKTILGPIFFFSTLAGHAYLIYVVILWVVK